MDDWEALKNRLLSGKNGGAYREMADSPEARRLEEKLSSREAESALRSGDPERIRSLLRQVLSTPEGRALAEKLSGAGEKKP